MIVCIQIGPHCTAQGTLIRKWTEPRRYAPDFNLVNEERAIVSVDDTLIEGQLIKAGESA